MTFKILLFTFGLLLSCNNDKISDSFSQDNQAVSQEGTTKIVLSYSSDKGKEQENLEVKFRLVEKKPEPATDDVLLPLKDLAYAIKYSIDAGFLNERYQLTQVKTGELFPDGCYSFFSRMKTYPIFFEQEKISPKTLSTALSLKKTIVIGTVCTANHTLQNVDIFYPEVESQTGIASAILEVLRGQESTDTASLTPGGVAKKILRRVGKVAEKPKEASRLDELYDMPPQFVSTVISNQKEFSDKAVDHTFRDMVARGHYNDPLYKKIEAEFRARFLPEEFFAPNGAFALASVTSLVHAMGAILEHSIKVQTKIPAIEPRETTTIFSVSEATGHSVGALIVPDKDGKKLIYIPDSMSGDNPLYAGEMLKMLEAMPWTKQYEIFMHPVGRQVDRINCGLYVALDIHIANHPETDIRDIRNFGLATIEQMLLTQSIPKIEVVAQVDEMIRNAKSPEELEKMFLKKYPKANVEESLETAESGPKKRLPKVREEVRPLQRLQRAYYKALAKLWADPKSHEKFLYQTIEDAGELNLQDLAAAFPTGRDEKGNEINGIVDALRGSILIEMAENRKN